MKKLLLLLLLVNTPLFAKINKQEDYWNNITQKYKNYSGLKNYDKLLDLSIKPNDIAKKEHTYDYLAISYLELGKIYDDQGNFDKAEINYKKALSINLKHHGKSSLEVAYNLYLIAEIKALKNEFKKALPYARQSEKIFRKKVGENNRDWFLSAGTLAIIYTNLGEFDKAKLLFHKLLKNAESNFGKDHPNYYKLVLGISQFYTKKQDMREAEKWLNYYSRLISDIPNKSAVDSTQLLYISHFYHEKGNLKLAEEYVLRSLQAVRESLPTNYLLIAQNLNALGAIYNDEEKYDKAEKSYKEALSMLQESHNNDAATLGIITQNLGFTYHKTQRFEEAEKCYLNAIEIYKKLSPDILLSDVLNNLASLYLDQLKYKEAEILFKDSIRLIESIYGKDSINIATNLNNLSTLYYRQKSFDAAEKNILRAINISESNLGKEHANLVNYYIHLANIYISQKEYINCLKCIKHALAIKIKNLIHYK